MDNSGDIAINETFRGETRLLADDGVSENNNQFWRCTNMLLHMLFDVSSPDIQA